MADVDIERPFKLPIKFGPMFSKVRDESSSDTADRAIGANRITRIPDLVRRIFPRGGFPEHIAAVTVRQRDWD